MLKLYETMELEIILFQDDIVRTSNLSADNVKGYDEWNDGPWED